MEGLLSLFHLLCGNNIVSQDSIYEISNDTTVLFLFNDSVSTEDRKKRLQMPRRT